MPDTVSLSRVVNVRRSLSYFFIPFPCIRSYRPDYFFLHLLAHQCAPVSRSFPISVSSITSWIFGWRYNFCDPAGRHFGLLTAHLPTNNGFKLTSQAPHFTTLQNFTTEIWESTFVKLSEDPRRSFFAGTKNPLGVEIMASERVKML